MKWDLPRFRGTEGKILQIFFSLGQAAVCKVKSVFAADPEEGSANRAMQVFVSWPDRARTQKL